MQRTSEEIAPLVALYAPQLPAAMATNAAGDEVHTTEPATFAASICRKPCLHVRKIPVRLVSTICFHVSIGISWISPPTSIPALAKMPQGAPNCACTDANACTTDPSSVTSHATPTAPAAPASSAA